MSYSRLPQPRPAMSASFRFGLVGLAAGIVIGVALGRWSQPVLASFAAGTPPPRSVSAESRILPGSSEALGRDRSLSPVATGPEVLSSTETPAVRGSQALENLLTALPAIPEDQRAAAVNDFVLELRMLGTAGIETIRDFLRRGEDFKLKNGVHIGPDRFIEAPTLRLALLDALYDSKDPVAVEVSLEALCSTPDLIEATLAIRNLEKRNPGVYREEALATVKELMQTQPLDDPAAWYVSNFSLDLLRHFKSTELLPGVERMLVKYPHQVSDYFTSLRKFDSAEQQVAVQRILNLPTVSAQIIQNPYALQNLDVTVPGIRQQMLSIFSRMSPRDQDRYLSDFAMFGFTGNSGFLSATRTFTGPDPEEKARVATAKLELLEQFQPYANTPVLQQRITEARGDLKEQLRQK